MRQPSANSSEAIEQAWDTLAQEYAGTIGPAGQRRALAAVELAVVLREMPSATARQKILDAGGGTGWHAVKLAELGHSVTLVDISSRMLAIAGEAARGAGVEGHIRSVKADIRSMQALPPESFDMAVACGTVVSDCGGPADALKTFFRVLRRGGKACFSVRGLHSVRARTSSEHLAERARVVRGHSAFDWHLFSRCAIEQLCHSAGLSLLRAVPVGCEPPPPDDSAGNLEEYVRRHLQATDNEPALQKSMEIMAVAKKADS